jgi:hypothetical protein
LGVPTQINIISEEITAFFKSLVKINLFAKKFFLINSSKPGSYIGEIPDFNLLILD